MNYEDRVTKEYVEGLLAGCGNCKIHTGSYVGTGTYGENNPNTLTFPFEPKIVFISRADFDGNINVQLSPIIGVNGIDCTYRMHEKSYGTMWTFSATACRGMRGETTALTRR